MRQISQWMMILTFVLGAFSVALADDPVNTSDPNLANQQSDPKELQAGVSALAACKECHLNNSDVSINSSTSAPPIDSSLDGYSTKGHQ